MSTKAKVNLYISVKESDVGAGGYDLKYEALEDINSGRRLIDSVV